MTGNRVINTSRLIWVLQGKNGGKACALKLVAFNREPNDLLNGIEMRGQNL